MPFDFTRDDGEGGRRQPSLLPISIKFNKAVSFLEFADDWHSKKIGVFSCLSGSEDINGLVDDCKVLIDMECDKSHVLKALNEDIRVKTAKLDIV